MNPEPNPRSLLKDGDYARKQIYCPSRVVAWSHGSRFDLAQQLVAPAAGGRLLDYGCGDGTFIALVHEKFRDALGVDVDPGQIEQCAARLGALPHVRFGLTRDLAGADAGGWDAVTCMEVLEHCLEDERRRVLDRLGQLAAPGGLVVVSVPIEVGPSVAAKQFFRALAGLRRLGDYAHRERYSMEEMMTAVLGRPLTRERFVGQGPDGPFHYHGHKGFDYRILEGEFRQRFRAVRKLFTPMRWLGPVLNSQVWLMGNPR